MTREEIRKRIDTIDAQLVMLFTARMGLCEELAVAKRELGLPVEDPEREAEKLEEVKSLVDAEALEPYVEEFFNKIFEISKGYQNDVQTRIQSLLKAAEEKAEKAEAAGKSGLKFGLVGGKLSHSMSKALHEQISKELGLEYSYDLFEVEAWDLDKFMDETDLDGFNVTIPHKKQIMKYCSHVSELAERVGAVNTVVREADGWHGYNTDYAGFKYMVEHSGYDVEGKHALVLGSGGASATAETVLRDMGAAEVSIMTHNDMIWLEELNRQGRYVEIAGIDAVAGAQLIVNTTPVGMYPNAGEYPMDISNVWRVEAVMDVVYNPARTRIMMDAESRDKVTVGGLGMLVVQATEAAKILFEKAGGTELDMNSIKWELDRLEPKLIEELSALQENVVIIGMPGCGKTTVGRIVADATGKKFIDSDEEIMARTGKTIREIFDTEGEEGFRRIEAEVLADLGQKSGLVISTGGGCVTTEANYNSLHQNGRVIWIQRRLEDLETAGRPISEARPLQEIYEERRAQYEDFADFAIDGDQGMEMAFQNVMAALRS